MPLSGVTRRGFVGGVAAGGITRLAAGSLLGATAGAATAHKPCTPTAPGIRTTALAASRDGRTLWSADGAATTITAHSRNDLVRGRSLDVGGAPIDLAISPDGTTALVVCAAYDRPGLALVDLRTGQRAHVDAGAQPRSVAVAPDGRTAWVAGGGADGALVPVDLHARDAGAPIALGAHPHGVAITADGERALVALNGDSAVAVVDLRARKVAKRIATAAFPHLVAVSPGGRHAIVTHNGYASRRATPLDLVHGLAGAPVRTGLDPSAVAYARDGRVALVADSGSASVSVLDGRTGRRRRRVAVGGTPRAVAFAGTRPVVADAHSGLLTPLKTAALR